MTEKIFKTPSGTIHYWIQIMDADMPTLAFLPGLTADHGRLCRTGICGIVSLEFKRFCFY